MKMISTKAIPLGFLLLILWPAVPVLPAPKIPATFGTAGKGGPEASSALVKVERAYAEGLLSLDDWARYVALALFEPQRLPAEFRSPTDERCTTWMLNQVLRHWYNLRRDTREHLVQYGFTSRGTLARPVGLDSSRTTAHFKIHYSVAAGDAHSVDPTDNNQNGTPDYIELVAQILEAVWVTETDSMGYVVPPPDTLSGDAPLYDVYIFNLSPAGTYGYVAPDSLIQDNPSSSNRVEHNAATSYMALRNHYLDFSGSAERNLKVTVAHELFHSVQFGYDAFEKAWLKEATATWIEDEVYDTINDNYQYLESWFQRPWMALDATPSEAGYNHWYGSWIFFRYLSEHHGGPSIVRRIWDYSVLFDSRQGDFSFGAIEEAISDFGSSFADVFVKFHVTNLLKTVQPYHYEEGTSYPDLFTYQVFDPAYDKQTQMMRYAADFYEIEMPYRSDPQDGLEIRVTPIDSMTIFQVQVVAVAGQNVQIEEFSPYETRSYRMQNIQNWDRIYVIVTNMDDGGVNGKYRIEIQRDIKLTRLAYGFLVSKNRHALMSLVADSLRYIVDAGAVLLPGVQGFSQSETHDVFAYSNSADSVFIYRNKQPQPLVVPDSIFIYSYPERVSVADVDSEVVWIAGRAIYKATPRSGSRGDYYQLEKISDEGRILEHYVPTQYKLIASGGRAAWLNEYWDSNNVYHTDLWLYENGRPRKLHAWQGPYRPIVDAWDFRDDILVWAKVGHNATNDTVTYYQFSTRQEVVVDNQTGVWQVKTAAGKIAWNSGSRVFLWDGTRQTQLYGPPDEDPMAPSVSWLAMDSTGVAWATVEESSQGVITPTFFYYDYSERQSYFTPQPEMNLLVRLPQQHRGRFLLQDGIIYFSAVEIAGPVQWPSVFALQMRNLLPTTVESGESNKIPDTFELKPNFPNPFSKQTTLLISLSRPGPVEVKVYDILGRLVYSDVRKEVPAGEYRLRLATKNWGSGVYFYQIRVRRLVKVGKMMIVR